ncbi:hypothetical protein BGX30_013535 [Mortierella sp. GBA39]|nr:hypothetical protein BGX30_013535 [Mortierella sp. GBA39]
MREAQEKLQPAGSGQPADAEMAADDFSPGLGGEKETVYYSEMISPIGPLTLCATEKGLCLIEFGPFNVKEAVLQKWSRTWCGGGDFVQDDEQIRSYADIANAIGRPKAVRAVGGANNKNPVPLIVPCHRVIGADGSLVGYGGGMEIKRHLLTLENSLPERKGWAD